MHRVTATIDGALTVGSAAGNAVVIHPGERDRVPLSEALESWVRTEPLILSPL